MRPRIALVSALTTYEDLDAETMREPPTGVLTLASVMRDRFATTVVDLNNIFMESEGEWDEFFRLASTAISETGADLLGFSSICTSYPTTIRLAGLVARELPESYIVFGGPQASVVDVSTLEAFDYIDAVVRGEAEESLPALVQGFAEGQPPLSVAGVSFRHGGSIQRNPSASAITDLDALPMPAFDLHPFVSSLEAIPLEIGRGCPFSCRFCSTNDFFRRRFRLKSPERTLGQMRELHDRYGIRKFDLIHDMFTVDRQKVVAFCELLISNGSPFEWACSARTDCIDEALLEIMKAAGCTGIFFGIETGSQRLQAVIDKGLDLSESRRMLATADRIGIKTTASLITGYPEETLEDFRQTLEFFGDAVQLPWLDPQLHILWPLAETPLTTEYRDRLFLDENRFERSENGWEQDALARELIAAHPDIFSNFYAFPCEIDRGFLQDATQFLIHASIRCNGLLQALRLFEGDLLRLAQRWYESAGIRRPGYDYNRHFMHDFLSFIDRQYGTCDDPGIIVTSRFWRALVESAPTSVRSSACHDEEVLCLNPDVQLISVEGDIVQVLALLRQGQRPPRSVLARTVTVVVQQDPRSRSKIKEMPPVSIAILRHAEKQSSVAEIISDLEERNVRVGSFEMEDVVLTAIEFFESEGLVRRISPEIVPEPIAI
jgi:radical SAM superfamily enzyme YgiQ (UPF0313 family)